MNTDNLNFIYVVITLDVERPNSETDSLASGPSTYEQGAASVDAYLSITREYSWPVTLFIHPEVAYKQAEIFKSYERNGSCLGLHLHPWRYNDGRYAAELGALSESDTRAVLSEATISWAESIGRRPIYFRAGACSSNDNTFRILADLGFIGGSTSLPGRNYPDVYASWMGANPDPHRAHPVFRQLTGTLDYVEMPISVDLSRMVYRNGRSFHWDLRPEFPTEPRKLAQNIVRQVHERRPAVPVINMVTHNDNEFSGESGNRLRRVFDAIQEACEREKLTVIPATIADIVELTFKTPIATVGLNKASGKVVFEEVGSFQELDVPLS